MTGPTNPVSHRDFDGFIVMGRPVEPNFQEIIIALKEGVDLSTPYPGSVQRLCYKCERAVWIGPRTLDVIKDRPDDAVICCPQHAAELANHDNIDVTVHDLGNKHPTDQPPST